MHLGNVVIGKSLESMMFSVLLDNSSHIDNGFVELNPNEGSKKKLRSFLKLYLSLSGKSLNFEKVSKIRIRDNNCKILCEKNSTQHTFDNCIVFESENLDLENEILSHKKNKMEVTDYFKISGVSKNYSFDTIKLKDPFVNRIYPYNSGRVAGSKYVTDLKVISFLDQEGLSDFSYSDTMVRFKLEKLLNSVGFRFKASGTLKSGEVKYSRPGLEHMERVVKSRDEISYKDSESVVFTAGKNIIDVLRKYEKA